MSASLFAALLLQSTAQTPPSPPPPPPPSVADQSKVVSYPAVFFVQYRPDTALDMLNRLPGFTVDIGGAQRGFAGGEGNVRIDGQLPPSRGDNIRQILQRIPASSIERIDLVTGGAEGIDMQGQSVIANIIRKPDGGVQVTTFGGVTVYPERDLIAPTARLEVQRSGAGKLLEGIIYFFDEPFGSLGSRSRGAPTALSPSFFDNEVLNHNARFSGAYETPLAAGKVRVNATIGQTDNRFSVLDAPLDATLPSAEIGRQILQLGEAGGRYSRNLEGGTALEASLFHQYRRSDSDSTFTQGPTHQRFFSDNRQGEDILRGIARLPSRGAWAFDGGAEAAYNWLDTDSHLIISGVEIPVPSSQTEVGEIRGEVFGSGVWTVSPKLSVQFGLRVEASTITTSGSADLEKTLTFIKPRVIATWKPAAAHLAVLRVERTVDQLSFGDFSASASLTNQTIVSGNPDLEPAENLIIEARYEYRFAGRGALVLSYEHYDIDNVVGRTLFPVPGGFIEAADNIGSGTRETFFSSLTTPLDRLGVAGGLVRLSGIWRDSEIIDPTTLTPRRFSNETPWEVGLTFSQDIPRSKWRWGIDAYAVGDLVTYLPREIQIGEVTPNLAAWVEYRPATNVTVRVDGFNLTDRESDFTRERYSGPRGTSVVNFVDRRQTHGLNGGEGLRASVRKTF